MPSRIIINASYFMSRKSFVLIIKVYWISYNSMSRLYEDRSWKEMNLIKFKVNLFVVGTFSCSDVNVTRYFLMPVTQWDFQLLSFGSEKINLFVPLKWVCETRNIFFLFPIYCDKSRITKKKHYWSWCFL